MIKLKIDKWLQDAIVLVDQEVMPEGLRGTCLLVRTLDIIARLFFNKKTPTCQVRTNMATESPIGELRMALTHGFLCKRGRHLSRGAPFSRMGPSQLSLTTLGDESRLSDISGF